MYSNSSGNNYGYGRGNSYGSSMNYQAGKYSGSSATGYGLGQGGSASTSLGPSGTKAGRTRDSQSYGTSK